MKEGISFSGLPFLGSFFDTQSRRGRRRGENLMLRSECSIVLRVDTRLLQRNFAVTMGSIVRERVRTRILHGHSDVRRYRVLFLIRRDFRFGDSLLAECSFVSRIARSELLVSTHGVHRCTSKNSIRWIDGLFESIGIRRQNRRPSRRRRRTRPRRETEERSNQTRRFFTDLFQVA